MPALWLNGHNYTGGGGNANEQVLKWDEYCALTPEEKMNGTTYYITDVNGDGSDFQPVIYSEDEREIGVWTDGRPLYEKTYTFNTTLIAQGSGRWTPTEIDGSNISTIVDCKSLISGYFWAFSALIDNGVVNVVNPYSGSIDIDTLVLRYTKTTDQPGSGTWTPQGVPAVHYDGNEKVVGTWFGETLYEKTLNSNISGAVEHWYVYLDTLINGINDYTIINWEGFIQFQEDGVKYAMILPDISGDNVYINRNSGRWYLYWHSGNATCTWGIISVTIRYVKTIIGQPTS